MEEIEACPFCGNTPELYISDLASQYDGINNRQYTSLRCNTCRLPDGTSLLISGEIINNGVNPVLEFWNKRF